jgi:hypothetical protein
VAAAAALGVFGGLVVTTLFGAFTASALSGDRGSYVLDLVAGAPTWYVLPILLTGLAGSVGQGAINLYATGLDMASLVPRLKRAQATLITTLAATGLVFLGTFALSLVRSTRWRRRGRRSCSSASSRAAAAATRATCRCSTRAAPAGATGSGTASTGGAWRRGSRRRSPACCSPTTPR